MLRLRPLLVTRLANAFGGLALAYIPFAVLLYLLEPDDSTTLAVAVPFALAGPVLAVRGYRLGWCTRSPYADTSQSHHPDRGRARLSDHWILYTRWRDQQGRRRKTPVMAFTSPLLSPVASFVTEHSDRSVKELRR
ncbi:hypothetical protein [Nonomuraea sp. NPDC048826]|uniref:hypothetical protein n=1 Tax=Nonomuraea sp. NPDC048826 TaxID=3364347 RepID=UPI0037149137